MTDIQKAGPQRTRALAEGMLDGMAISRAAATGEAYEKAYAAVLETPDGRELYDIAWQAAKAHRDLEAGRDVAVQSQADGAGFLKTAEAAEASIDAMAKSRSEQTGEAYVTAYAEVIKSAEGRRLYAESCEARERVR